MRGLKALKAERQPAKLENYKSNLKQKKQNKQTKKSHSISSAKACVSHTHNTS